MSRSLGAGWVCALALVFGAGCQDYNFNPVGRCVIQPGTERVTLSNVSSADVLFVVDDSRSMAGEQAALASNFTAFIANLDAKNAARRSAGLEPFDFHIAVTTTSMFFNYQTAARPSGPYVCKSTCTGAEGQKVCCRADNTPAKAPRACTPGVTACPAGTTCGTNCGSPFPSLGEPALRGENYCCDQATGTFPAGSAADLIPCSVENTECGTMQRHYGFAACSAGVGVDGWPYPQGDFVSWTSGATANPRVLHFDKELYPETPNPAATNRQGFTRQQLIDFFKGNGAIGGNVVVGTCGSGEETALAAARAALEKARDGLQRDTYARASATPQQTWTARTATGGGGVAASAADWFAPGASSKLVVVFVGDEDDCTPIATDPSGAVVWDADDVAGGVDSCAKDAERAAPLGRKQLAVDEFVAFFTGLGREVAAGFILPADNANATNDACTLATCTATGAANRCCPVGGCTDTEGAQGSGIRLLDTAQKLSAAGVSVVAGSVCDPSFGTILDAIADLVPPTTGLILPTTPASDEVTLLRIATSAGTTRKVCTGPLAPLPAPNNTLPNARATGVDWWFTANADPGPPAAGATRYVYINPEGSCVANPGETYSADYLGRLPANGCWDDAGLGSGDEMCRRILGGAAGSWTCFAGLTSGGACVAPTPGAPGTCICGSAAENGCARP